MTDHTKLEGGMTLDEITTRFPGTIDVFNRFGMDMCCGGGVTLAEAATRDGVDVGALRGALEDALAHTAPGRRA